MQTRTFYQMTKAKDKVQWLLQQYPHLRDSDERLIANYWYYQIGGDRFNLMTAQDLLDMFCMGKLTNAETIRRCRAKLQEQHPELRGLTYLGRQIEGDDFTQEIHHL